MTLSPLFRPIAYTFFQLAVRAHLSHLFHRLGSDPYSTGANISKYNRTRRRRLYVTGQRLSTQWEVRESLNMLRQGMIVRPVSRVLPCANYSLIGDLIRPPIDLDLSVLASYSILFHLTLTIATPTSSGRKGGAWQLERFRLADDLIS
jgi:hypothetical protein